MDGALGIRREKRSQAVLMFREELRVHSETDVERMGARADADTERLAEEIQETAEERRRNAYRLT